MKKGVNSKTNKESLIALYLPSNSYQKIHYHEFPLIKENKWKNGAITKYDIPQYIRDIPEEFPAFCTIKEAGSLRNIKKREEKKKKILDNNTQTNIDNNSNNNNKDNILEEPIPNEMHKYCHLCKKQFDNYLRHINTKSHKDNNLKYNDTFKSIKNIFGRVNNFWNNKVNNENNNKENIQSNSNNNDNNNDIISFDDLNNDNLFKYKLFTQYNLHTSREGCQAKKKIFVANTINSQLSTAQSFPIIPPKKRKKNDIKKSKDKDKSKSKKNKNNNKSINEFLIRIHN